MSTKERLAEALEKAGLPKLAARARAGDFSDFESASPTPKYDLVQKLLSANTAAARELCRRVIDGRFDDTKAESDAWMRDNAAEIFGSGWK